MAGATKVFTGIHEVALPSGYIVRCRKPSLFTLIAAGVFPNELTAIAMQLTDRKDDSEFTKTIQTPEGLKQFAAMMDVLLLHVLHDPKPVLDPPDAPATPTACTVDNDNTLSGTINIKDVDDNDKQWLFLWSQRLLQAPRQGVEAKGDMFREGTERPAAGPGVETVRAATLEDAGPPSEGVPAAEARP